jgi:hypothetical protein
MVLDLPLAQERRMHQGRAADAVVQRFPVEEAGAKFAHGAAEEIDIFAKLDFRVEASEALHARATDESGAADEQGLVEDHAGSEAKARAEPAADRGAPGGAAKKGALVAHLRVRGVAERRHAAEHDADLGLRRESRFRGGVIPLRHEIVVVKKMHDPAAGERPAEIAHPAWKAAGRSGVPDVARRTGKLGDHVGG